MSRGSNLTVGRMRSESRCLPTWAVLVDIQRNHQQVIVIWGRYRMRYQMEGDVNGDGSGPPELSRTGRNVKTEAVCYCSAARGRPIIVEWERDARHSAGLSRSVTHRYVTERYTFHNGEDRRLRIRRSPDSNLIPGELVGGRFEPPDPHRAGEGDLRSKPLQPE
ncbi:hypothetical protein EVAR_60381_1 [Eumeta japonica]|uniref:Uncharacterized protein n=1 Tax=Eumeta variegata TaxID=151549 RepID=A0A4C1ZPD8_EUMVA|nr:hypothetical protein EVAR_60381_1 [Eumeta japonica]